MFAALPFPNIAPEILSVELFGFTLALRWYAMAYVVGIAIGWQIIKAALKRPRAARRPADLYRYRCDWWRQVGVCVVL